MSNDAQREALRKLNGESCNRGGSEDALRVTLGKRTSECSYRTPVIGRDLEIGATARLLSGTPKGLRKQAFLALDLRAGEEGAHYQLAVYPLQRKAQLRSSLPGREHQVSEDRQGRRRDQGNQRTERTCGCAPSTSPAARTKAPATCSPSSAGELVADVTDDAAGELQGRASSISLGASKSAKGLVGSFDDVVVRVPNPFE